MSELIGQWTLGVQRALWRDHGYEDGCDGSECPMHRLGRVGLSDEYDRTTRVMERELTYRARALLQEMVERFAADHPEAVRASW